MILQHESGASNEWEPLPTRGTPQKQSNIEVRGGGQVAAGRVADTTLWRERTGRTGYQRLCHDDETSRWHGTRYAVFLHGGPAIGPQPRPAPGAAAVHVISAANVFRIFFDPCVSCVFGDKRFSSIFSALRSNLETCRVAEHAVRVVFAFPKSHGFSSIIRCRVGIIWVFRF